MNQPNQTKQISGDIPYRDPEAIFSLVGTNGNGKNAFLSIGEAALAGHTLLLGSPGTGKSNMLCHLLRNLRVNLTEKDVLVVFDPKGEHYRQFAQAGDIVFADDARASDGVGEAQWNLFKELTGSERVLQDASAICDMLFGEQIREAREPGVPTAARELMLALTVYLCRQDDPGLRNNETLRGLIDGFDTESMLAILKSLPEFGSAGAYLADPDAARNVALALQRTARALFQGRFNASGTLGIRTTLRRRNGKVVFVGYDPARARDTGAIYAAILDQCLCEVLSRAENEGSVYLLLDGACALPKLNHLEDAMLFGGEKGLRVVMALSNLHRLADRYGDAGARTVLDAFGTVIAFRLHDPDSRAYLCGRCGDRRAAESPAQQTRGTAGAGTGGFAVTDGDLTTLKTGESIVCTRNNPPFYFHIKRYGA